MTTDSGSFMVPKSMDPGAAARMFGALSRLDDLSRRLASIPRLPPDGSLWQADLSASPRYGRFVGLYAAQAIATAVDHLFAWQQLAENAGLGPSSPWTLARGGLEGAGRALWHQQPTAPPQRLARAIATRRHDQEERRKFEAASGPGPRIPLPAGGLTADQRLARLEEHRKNEGIDRVDYDGPTAVAREFGYERHYRLASGFAHGLEYAMGTGDLDWKDITTNPGTRLAYQSANDEHLAELAESAVAMVERAVAALEAYARGR